ncbi:MAG: tetratricopeptide repeat protein, partial [Deltaproteobacteria bacterium]|nr:tetratricopeptide repeat protein [Deltaproteobacteria bacterium]
MDHYKKALTVYEQVYGDRWEPVQRAVLERKIGEALYRRGNHEQAMGYFCSALAHLGRPLPATRWGIRANIIKHLGLQIFHRLLPMFFVCRQSLPVDDKLEEVSQIYELMGWIDYALNRERMLLYALSGLNEVEVKAHLEGTLQGYVGLGLICGCFGLFRWAGRYCQRAYGLMDQVQNPLLKGFCYLGLGHHEDALGNWDEAIKHYQQAGKRYWQVGNVRRWGEPEALTAILLNKQGKFAESFAAAQEITRVGEESGDMQLSGWGAQI